MKIERFEDIKAWREARVLTRLIYEASSDSKFKKDFALRDQIRRAAVSVMANIAEGFGRKSRKEFIQFLSVAHASALEVQSHLYVAMDLGYIGAGEFERLCEQANKTSRLIGGFINYLENSTAQSQCEKPTQRKPRNEKHAAE